MADNPLIGYNATPVDDPIAASQGLSVPFGDQGGVSLAMNRSRADIDPVVIPNLHAAFPRRRVRPDASARQLRLIRRKSGVNRSLVCVDSPHARVHDVICGGMYRACSTWQYEVVGHLVERHLRGQRLGYLTGAGVCRRTVTGCQQGFRWRHAPAVVARAQVA